jgi:hypothetical protein
MCASRQGFNGKCNVDDIIAIRALAFDIDLFQDISLIEKGLPVALRPSLIINTGGGLHLLYLFKDPINVNLYRSSPTDEQKKVNDFLVKTRSRVSQLANDFEAMLHFRFPKLKIDGMSNIDRVMRLPGTVNYPKAEKRARGQIEALAHIAKDYQTRFTFAELRSPIPMVGGALMVIEKKLYVPRPGSKWTTYKKATACCQFLCDIGEADTNDWYVRNVMLPLIGCIHQEHDPLTADEAFECFMLVVSGGARYGTPGRGPGYFARQWKSHHPFGMKTNDTIAWEEDFERQRKDLEAQHNEAPQGIVDELRRFISGK